MAWPHGLKRGLAALFQNLKLQENGSLKGSTHSRGRLQITRLTLQQLGKRLRSVFPKPGEELLRPIELDDPRTRRDNQRNGRMQR